jgi:hypothetical protein
MERLVPSIPIWCSTECFLCSGSCGALLLQFAKQQAALAQLRDAAVRKAQELAGPDDDGVEGGKPLFMGRRHPKVRM